MASRACPICESQNTQQVIDIRDVPVFCNVLLDTKEEALNVAKGDIVLDQCRDCGHVYNAAFQPELVAYGQVYENSLHFSPRFQAFACALAEELVERYGLHGKQIVEIGSGRGDFLDLLCRLGPNRGIGFDPSYCPPEGSAHGPIQFIQEYYSEAYDGVPVDFLCSRHTLEHVDEPAGFVRMIRRSIGDRAGVPVYVEVPNVLYTLRDLGIWDLIYEHVSYFCASSLSRLFAANGFEICNVTERYAGQFLSIEVQPAQAHNAQNGAAVTRGAADGAGNDTEAHIADFARAYAGKVETMQRTLAEVRRTGKTCVLWGAGSKGVTFLNVLDVADEVAYVVDINARKQGKHVAGTGQPIVAPAYLATVQPDLILVMNPIYTDEIGTMLGNMGLAPELLVV